MSQYLTAVRSQQSNLDHSVFEEFSPQQLQESYCTIFALKMKLDAAVRDLERTCRGKASPAFAAVESTPESLVDAAIRDRARRTSILPADLFAEPAWDMLLELYRAELHQYRLSVSALCIASQGPSTTALRWISTLESEGLASRAADPLDRRRFYIHLTGHGSMAMTAYFSDRLAVDEAQPCTR